MSLFSVWISFVTMFWGLTPALDLLDEFLTTCRPKQEINILVLGGADARHILKTLSQLYRHEEIQVNFYAIDKCLESTARQLLLLNVALEEPQDQGLLFRVKLLMELYGNTLVRPAVAKYLTAKAKQLVEIITDSEYCSKVMPIVSLDGLKYKERDYVANTFKYWYNAEPCDISALWERRVRQALGTRYDSRAGVFDWDLHMRLHPAGATQLCPQEYKHWRATGVAFTWLESEVCRPNRTLVAGIVPSGQRYLHHGYVGDIVAGPFAAFGFDCSDKEMLRRANNVNVHRATDVTEHNLLQLLHGLHERRVCVHAPGRATGSGAAVADLPEQRPRLHAAGDEPGQQPRARGRCVRLGNAAVHFLSSSELQHMGQKEKFKNFYNIIYFSGMFMENLDPDLINYISNSNCLLIIENEKYTPSNKKEQLEELSNNIKSKLTTLADAIALTFDPNKDWYAMYLIEK